jgi:O-succinylbenzoic acid--CoA ligase
MQLRQVAGAALVDGIAQALAGAGPLAPVCDPRLESALGLGQPVTEPDAALVVPTSGTTSTPKAVVLSASAIRFAAHATHARLGGPGDWVCALPTQHVAGLMTIARAVVARTRVDFVRPDLADLPHAGERSYLSLVAAQLHQALNAPELVSRLAGYHAILLGGSAVNPELLEGARAAGLRVVTTYGPVRPAAAASTTASRWTGSASSWTTNGSCCAARWHFPATGCGPTSPRRCCTATWSPPPIVDASSTAASTCSGGSTT